MSRSTADLIADHLRPGMRVAVADGAGAPLGLKRDLTAAAASVGGINLLLGWCLDVPVDLETDAFHEVRTVMGGFALRDPIREGQVRYAPERLSAVPALLEETLRPDVLVVALRRGDDSWQWGCEVAWMSSVVDSGATLIVEDNSALPRTGRISGPTLDQAAVSIATHRPPHVPVARSGDEVTARLGESVAALVPEGAWLQYGPGPIADAVLARLRSPVHIRSGMLTDAVLGLDARGLLLSTPLAAYVWGSPDLYAWADDRGVTDRVERTHDPSGTSGAPWVTINTAVEVDLLGQIGVQDVAGRHVSGVGGLPDFALAGHLSPNGLSIVALPTHRGGHRTLVDRISGPVSVPGYDVDVLVTEVGAAELRGLDQHERGRAIRRLWLD